MAKCGCSIYHQTTSNTSYQISNRKVWIMWHHQDQHDPRSYVSHIQNLRAKSPHVQKRQTRIIPADYEGLQGRKWRDRNHILYRKNPLPTYYVTQGGSKRIRGLGRPSWEHDQRASQVNQGGLTRVFPPHQHTYQAEMIDDTWNAKTSRSPIQDIIHTTNRNE